MATNTQTRRQKPQKGAGGSPVNADRVALDKLTRFNPCKFLTPSRLSAALEGWEQGRLADLAWIMDWIESTDDMILPVAQKSRAAVGRHGWDIVLDSDLSGERKARGEAQRDILQKFFRGLEVRHAVDTDEKGGVRLLASQMMDGYGKGYSAHHIVLEPDGQGGLKGRAIFVPLRFFENKNGDLRLLENYGAVHGRPLAELCGRDAWMISKGRGVMKACAIAWMFKHIPIRDWLTYCGRHGMPGFLGKTNAAYNSDGWKNIKTAVASMGAEYGAVISSTDAIEILNLTAQGQIPYAAMVDRMDRAISILWRGGDLGTISRGDAVGADPQGNEAAELDSDNAAWLSETVDAQLADTVVRYYFGNDVERLAHFQFRQPARVDFARDFAIVQGAVSLGAQIDRAWFAEKFNIPEAEADEEGNLPPLLAPLNLQVNDPHGIGPGAGPAGSPTGRPQMDSPFSPFASANATQILPDPDGRAATLAQTLAKALGIRAAELAPVQNHLAELALKASSGGAWTDEEFLDFWEAALLKLPEFFDPDKAAEIGRAMESALGAAAFSGARDGMQN